MSGKIHIFAVITILTHVILIGNFICGLMKLPFIFNEQYELSTYFQVNETFLDYTDSLIDHLRLVIAHEISTSLVARSTSV